MQYYVLNQRGFNRIILVVIIQHTYEVTYNISQDGRELTLSMLYYKDMYKVSVAMSVKVGLLILPTILYNVLN